MNFYVISPDEKDRENRLMAAKAANAVAKAAALPHLINPIIPLVINQKLGEINAEPVTLEETGGFVNAVNANWKVDELYIEHPRRNKLLIPKKDYKDYILREMVSDLANYIMDNMSVSQLVIGIASSSKGNADVSIPIEDIVVDAECKCYLAKKYMVHYENSAVAVTPRDHIWIDLFPDVKSAVEHKTTTFEWRQETTLDFGLDANIAKAFLADLGFEKKTSFYIYYNI